MKNILKHKNKIIAGSLIIAVLAFVFWWGGDSPSLRRWNPNETATPTQTHLTGEEKMQLAEEIAKDKETQALTKETQEPIINQEDNEEYSVEQGMEIDHETGKDKYKTNPVSEGQPVPVKPQEGEICDKIEWLYTCDLGNDIGGGAWQKDE